MGNWTAAADLADRQRQIPRRIVTRELPFLPDTEQLVFVEQIDAIDFAGALALGWERRADPALAARSAEWLINGQGVAQEALAQRSILARDKADPALAPMVQRLQDARRHRANLSLSPAKPDRQKERAEALADLDARCHRLEQQLTAAGIESPTEPWVDLAAVRKRLAANDVYIGLAQFGPWDWRTAKPLPARYAAWIVPPTGDVRLIDLGPADAIDAAVQAARNAIAHAAGQDGDLGKLGEPDAEKVARAELEALAQLVLHPIVEAAGGRTKWFLSPDGQLWLAPWAALPPPDGKYAVETLTITLLTSGRDLVAAPAKPRDAADPPKVFADPDFDLDPASTRAQADYLVPGRPGQIVELRGLSSDGGRLPLVGRLPNTGAEAAAINPALQKFDGREPWIYQGRKALEEAAKAVKGPRVLVFSTHGFFLPDQEVETSDRLLLNGEKTGPVKVKGGGTLENPLLRCGLLLTGCNRRGELAAAGLEDGVLTGLEVCGLDLRGTDLVVLSACETGVGDVHNGEGVAGLRQAFQLAGARAVLASLWQVEDLSTAQLMTAFFDGLANKKNKAEALRDAQIAMIKQRREKHNAAHPFFWAAFTLTGQ